ncbi:interferon-inducible GTPase 1-like [Mya arenaria]|uniref:interferon-inducible GTPase 1-like n=1 Tax=Mya arenaria TaxID=6604 RepID=UPI0022DEB7BF|nr:interferon-inducible GTPase 1-like [Mya arenaria]
MATADPSDLIDTIDSYDGQQQRVSTDNNKEDLQSDEVPGRQPASCSEEEVSYVPGRRESQTVPATASLNYSEINIEPQVCNKKMTSYMKLLKEKGSDAVKQELQKDLNIWKDLNLLIAVVGESGSGKSALINAFLNLTADDEGSAPVGTTETTGTIKSYINPKHPNLAFWDFPGIGTPKYKKNIILID